MENILVVDYDDLRGNNLQRRLSCRGHICKHIRNFEASQSILFSHDWDVLLLHLSPRNEDDEDIAIEHFLNKNKPLICFGGEGVPLPPGSPPPDLYKAFIERELVYFHGWPVIDGLEQNFNIEDWVSDLCKEESGFPALDLLNGTRINRARRLRCQVLTPFIALHLALQAHLKGRGGAILQIAEFKGLAELLEEYLSTRKSNDLLRFISLLSGEMAGEELKAFQGEKGSVQSHFRPFFTDPSVRKICGILADGSQDFSDGIEACLKNIERLAHNMEQIVNYVEFGEDPKWSAFN